MLDKKGQKGDGMPKRSHLGWRMRFFRCLHFALSFVGIWLQPLIVTKPGISNLWFFSWHNCCRCHYQNRKNAVHDERSSKVDTWNYFSSLQHG